MALTSSALNLYDSIFADKSEDLPKLAEDLVSIIRSYKGRLISGSDDGGLEVFETPKGIIIKKYYKVFYSFSIWFSGVPTRKFVSDLDKLKEKYQ
jgi:hypothetical protein